MICSSCLEWYAVKSRTLQLCRSCESQMFAEAAKEIDSKSLTIAELAGWFQSGHRPIRFKKAWIAK